MMNFYLDHHPKVHEMERISEHFKAYNQNFVEEKPSEDFHILALKNDQVVGGVTATIVWDWLMIDKLWVDEPMRLKGLGKCLLNEVERFALSHHVKKAAIGAFLESAKEFLMNNGFDEDGSLENRPPGYTYHFLEKTLNINNVDALDSPCDIEIKRSLDDVDYHYFNQKIELEQDKLLGDQPFKLLNIVARDESGHILGAVKGYVGWGWLYVSTIYVEDEYRHNKIGSILLKEIEETARKMDIHNSFAGTTDFQAKGFYEFNGYDVEFVREDLPIGHKNYTMMKQI